MAAADVDQFGVRVAGPGRSVDGCVDGRLGRVDRVGPEAVEVRDREVRGVGFLDPGRPAGEPEHRYGIGHTGILSRLSSRPTLIRGRSCWFRARRGCTVALPGSALATSGLRGGGSPLRRTMIGALLLGALGILGLAGPAAAFPLTNCTLQATALAADGSTIDSIASGATDATQTAPFLVDWDGTVTYTGNVQVAMLNNTWHVDVFGIPTPLRGGSPNQADNRDGNGTVAVGANAPFRTTGLYYVSGSITGSGGTCSGNGWFKLTGDPIGTIPFFIALLVLILGLLLLAAGSQGHTISAVVGGLLTGLGLAALLVLFSTLPLGSATPIVVLVLGLILGIIIAILARRSRGSSDASPLMPPTNPSSAPPA
jgi:hypothetical protein